MDHRSKKKKTKKVERTRKNQTPRHESKVNTEEPVDLTEVIHPIEHYINDKEEMINQVFSVMENEKLQSIIPPNLKSMTAQELKEKCVHELQEMSIEHILKILRGEPANPPPKGEEISTSPSTSCGSVQKSSNQGEQVSQNQTLLDILEEEMQTIAYQTIILKDKACVRTEQHYSELASSVSSDDLQVISPSNSSVELVCLDSTDSSLDGMAVMSNGENCAQVPKDVGDENEVERISMLSSQNALNDLSSYGESCPVRESENVEPKVAPKNNVESISPELRSETRPDQVDGSKISVPCLAESTEGVKNTNKESFMIRVFTGKSCTSERIVKKICQHSEAKNKTGEISPILSTPVAGNSKNESVLSNSPEHQLKCQVTSINNTINSPKKLELSGVASTQSTSDVSRDLEENLITAHSVLEDSCVNPSQDSSGELDLQGCEPSTTLKTTIDNILDKEEGEITEEESENDVELIDTVRDEHQSLTILLSSDDASELVEKKTSNKVLKRHKHHKRKHRRSDFNETLKRQIQKRGNRSYRQIRSSASEGTHNTGKEAQPSIEIKEKEKFNDAPAEANFQEAPSSQCGAGSKTDSEEIAQQIDLKEAGTESNKSCEVQNNQGTLSDGLSSEDGDSIFDGSDIPLEENNIPDQNESVPMKASWVDRWAEKKDLKRVVITSKIYTNVRKKILSRKKEKKNEEPVLEETLPSVPPLVLHVEGSVQEYQMLQWMSGDTSHAHDNSDNPNQQKHVQTGETSPVCISSKTEGTIGSPLSDKGNSQKILSEGLDPTTAHNGGSHEPEDINL